jgi:hypothetical protein
MSMSCDVPDGTATAAAETRSGGAGMTVATADGARASGARALQPRRPARSRSGGGMRWRRCSKRQAQQLLLLVLCGVLFLCNLAAEPLLARC